MSGPAPSARSARVSSSEGIEQMTESVGTVTAFTLRLGQEGPVALLTLDLRE